MLHGNRFRSRRSFHFVPKPIRSRLDVDRLQTVRLGLGRGGRRRFDGRGHRRRFDGRRHGGGGVGGGQGRGREGGCEDVAIGQSVTQFVCV